MRQTGCKRRDFHKGLALTAAFFSTWGCSPQNDGADKKPDKPEKPKGPVSLEEQLKEYKPKKVPERMAEYVKAHKGFAETLNETQKQMRREGEPEKQKELGAQQKVLLETDFKALLEMVSLDKLKFELTPENVKLVVELGLNSFLKANDHLCQFAAFRIGGKDPVYFSFGLSERTKTYPSIDIQKVSLKPFVTKLEAIEVAGYETVAPYFTVMLAAGMSSTYTAPSTTGFYSRLKGAGVNEQLISADWTRQVHHQQGQFFNSKEDYIAFVVINEMIHELLKDSQEIIDRAVRNYRDGEKSYTSRQINEFLSDYPSIYMIEGAIEAVDRFKQSPEPAQEPYALTHDTTLKAMHKFFQRPAFNEHILKQTNKLRRDYHEIASIKDQKTEELSPTQIRFLVDLYKGLSKNEQFRKDFWGVLKTEFETTFKALAEAARQED